MTVVLCDDHAMFVHALAEALESRGYDVLAVTDDPESAVAAVSEQAPDLCLLDVGFVEGSGLDAAARIRDISDKTRILLLTGAVTDPVWAAFEARLVDGVIRKTCDIEVVDQALSRAAAGERVVEGFRRHRPPHSSAAHLVRALTDRERAVLELVVAGDSTPVMADRLGIAESTVRTHIQSIFRKLGVSGRLKAANIFVAATAREGAADTSKDGWTWR